MHGLMPPHPGPVVAVEALHANTGMVLVWGFALGLPIAALAGPIFAKWAVKHVPVDAPEIEFKPLREDARLPGFALTMFSMLLPIALMLLARQCAKSRASSATPRWRC